MSVYLITNICMDRPHESEQEMAGGFSSVFTWEIAKKLSYENDERPPFLDSN